MSFSLLRDDLVPQRWWRRWQLTAGQEENWRSISWLALHTWLWQVCGAGEDKKSSINCWPTPRTGLEEGKALDGQPLLLPERQHKQHGEHLLILSSFNWHERWFRKRVTSKLKWPLFSSVNFLSFFFFLRWLLFYQKNRCYGSEILNVCMSNQKKMIYGKKSVTRPPLHIALCYNSRWNGPFPRCRSCERVPPY